MGSQLEQPLLPNTTTIATGSGSGISSSGPRILDRDGDFSQSRGRWRVSNVNSRSWTSAGSVRQRHSGNTASNTTVLDAHRSAAPTLPRRPRTPPPTFLDRVCCRSNENFCCCEADNQPRLTPRRCWDDWFHTLSHTPTCILMFGIFIAYFITIVIFAGLYLTVNKVGSHADVLLGSSANYAESSSFCGMDINNHMEALYFSLSTMATIGYGTSDYYFGDCWTPFILVLLQVFSAIVFSSLAVGLLFQRISRGQKRGRTIVFSDAAVIRKVGGSWYFMFRVAELRKRHVIGAKVRVYCVKHDRCPVVIPRGDGEVVELETAYFVSHPLSLMNGPSLPNVNNEEEPNSNVTYEQHILMGLPHVVVHRLDALSPMSPPRPVWYDEGGTPRGPYVGVSTTATFGESVSDDAATSNLRLGERQLPAGSTSSEEITDFLQDRQAEIIVLCEGTCEVTGMALQARQSYRLEDIAFHQSFAPCVFPVGSNETIRRRGRWNPFAKNRARVENPRDICHEEYNNHRGATLEIDFGQFHQLISAPVNSMSCPYIES